MYTISPFRVQYVIKNIGHTFAKKKDMDQLIIPSEISEKKSGHFKLHLKRLGEVYGVTVSTLLSCNNHQPL